MRRPAHNTTALPRQLREELGLGDAKNGRKQGGRHGPAGRKEKRKAEREQKKTQRRNMSHGRRDMESDAESLDDDIPVKTAPKSSSRKEAPQPKSILKKRSRVEEPEDSESFGDFDDEDEDEDSESDMSELVRHKGISRGVKEKLDQDDAEIAALEKKLGIKGEKKLPKAFHDDGLDDILGDLASGSEDESRKRKREGDEWLQSKRRKALGMDSNNNILEESEEGSDEDDDEELDYDILEESDSDGDGEASDFEGFEDDGPSPAVPKARENPYVAPVTPAAEKPAKYIPPSLRAPPCSESENLIRLRRQAQGYLNKLSEANLISILGDIEKLYRDYPRGDVTSTLIDLLFGLVFDKSTLNDTFLILHAGFIAAIYKVMGMDFGAELIQRLIERFDEAYEKHDVDDGSQKKELVNVISLLSQLYNLHVIGSSLVFDYIRLFLKEITELNTELLLKIIRNSGPQLRQDDPSALKDIALLIQPAIAQAGEGGLSVRTKFMIDTITDLKNNRMKTGQAASALSTEHITRMRKILGSLNSRNIRASEPLRVGRSDIHNSSKRGKWWLVGASWREGDDPSDNPIQAVSTDAVLPDTLGDDIGDGEVDLAKLAKAHRMNTDVRRSIFIAIMSATDYRDAHVRLTKLRLKRNQELEIPRVLIHCAAEEEAHNPYYTLIARRLCGERNVKKAFMYSLWDVFKRMGERNELDEEDMDREDNDDENSLTIKAIVNLAIMYGHLIADGGLTLGILKVLDFAYIQPKTKTFVELLLITIMLQTQQKKSSKGRKEEGGNDDLNEKPLVDIFMKTRETPQIVRGLIYFTRKVVAKSDIPASKREKAVVKWGSKLAVDTLKVVAHGGGNPGA